MPSAGGPLQRAPCRTLRHQPCSPLSAPANRSPGSLSTPNTVGNTPLIPVVSGSPRRTGCHQLGLRERLSCGAEENRGRVRHTSPGFMDTPVPSTFPASRSPPCGRHHRAPQPNSSLPSNITPMPTPPNSLHTTVASASPRPPLLQRPRVHLLGDIHWPLDDGICRHRDMKHE